MSRNKSVPTAIPIQPGTGPSWRTRDAARKRKRLLDMMPSAPPPDPLPRLPRRPDSLSSVGADRLTSGVDPRDPPSR